MKIFQQSYQLNIFQYYIGVLNENVSAIKSTLHAQDISRIYCCTARKWFQNRKYFKLNRFNSTNVLKINLSTALRNKILNKSKNRFNMVYKIWNLYYFLALLGNSSNKIFLWLQYLSVNSLKITYWLLHCILHF